MISIRYPAMVALAVVFMITLTKASIADDYPSRPVKIVASGAGTGNDVAARVVARGMSINLGQPVVVENKPGASGIVSFEFVAKQAPADGYTLLMADLNLAVIPVFIKELRFSPLKDLTPVSIVVDIPNLLATPAEAPWNSFPEMVTYAKSNPGKLNYGTPGLQSQASLTLEAIKYKYGINIVNVPFKNGSAQVRPALMQNEVQLGNYSEGMAAADGRRVKMIAVTGSKRLPAYPSVPSFAELGMADIEGSFFTISVPAGSPRPTIDKLNSALVGALKLSEVREIFDKNGFYPVGSTPEAAAIRLAEATRVFAEIAKRAGIQPE